MKDCILLHFKYYKVLDNMGNGVLGVIGNSKDSDQPELCSLTRAQLLKTNDVAS